MRIPVTLIALTPLLFGCGSIESLIKDQRIYGGVRNNAYYLSTAYGDPMPAPDNPLVAWLTWNSFDRELTRTFGPLFILDMPLCLVLDTVLLPVTVTTWLVRSDSTPVQPQDEGAPLGEITEPEIPNRVRCHGFGCFVPGTFLSKDVTTYAARYLGVSRAVSRYL